MVAMFVADNTAHTSVTFLDTERVAVASICADSAAGHVP